MKKYFVIGNPIEHSLSPLIHNHWIKRNKIDAIYEKKKLKTTELNDFILKLREKKINGINITIPFKQKVIPYLDNLSDEAKKTNSVNTIYVHKNKLFGHNTDVEGFELGMKDTKFNVTNKKVFILGAGGVVPSIIFVLKKMNVSKFDIKQN